MSWSATISIAPLIMANYYRLNETEESPKSNDNCNQPFLRDSRWVPKTALRVTHFYIGLM